MAADVPDPQTFKSWEDAFQYPVVATRRIEQRLRGEVTANKEKLRTLVGQVEPSLQYSGTAETIVDMDKQMQSVDTKLSLISQNCNLRTLERKSGNITQMQKLSASNNADYHTVAAQLSLLQKCQTSISRLLRERGSLLLAAKILVISRLLHKTLSTKPTRLPYLETLRNQLSSLRRTLLKRIDRYVAGLQASDEGLIETLCAFCLATSSTSADAIRHFHHLRKEKIAAETVGDGSNYDGITSNLKLYIQTLKETTGLLGRRFSDALSGLRNRPLIDDPHIHAVETLDLGIYQPWVADDVRHFTPWIKFDNLTKTDAKSVLNSWSKQAFEKFLDSLNSSLESVQNIEDLIHLRKQLLETWLPFHHTSFTHSALDVLKGLQASVNKRLIELLHSQAHRLSLVAEKVGSTISAWNDGTIKSRSSLWDPDLVDMDASGGAVTLKTELKKTQLGTSERVSGILESYKSWLSSIRSSQDALKTLRGFRWGDLLEDVDDAEDLDGMSVSEALSKQDPDKLSRELESSIQSSVIAFAEKLHSIAEAFKPPFEGQQAAFVLRILRQVRSSSLGDLGKGDSQLMHDAIPRLHAIVVKETLKSLLPLSFASTLIKNGARRTLWEGEPPLPVQPSPVAFKLLRRVTLAMSNLGLDLWSPAAVDAAKQALGDAIQNDIDQLGKPSTDDQDRDVPAVNGHNEEPVINGDVHAIRGEAQKPLMSLDAKVQLCFDLCYLDWALTPRAAKSRANQQSLVARLDHTASIDESAMNRMQKAASNYWHRTSLLFGLLA